MISLHVELVAREGAENDVAKVLAGLRAETAGEAGSVVYAVHRKVDAPRVFLLYELYRDRAACEAHLATAAVTSALRRFSELLEGPPRISMGALEEAHGVGEGAKHG
ncbi:MAG: antibiotic biosynthesis monooxygenase [Polyangiaceae bacterium]|nr:antibiotic biosynthesis monooxygenase [Polyangiaceae bacterium]